MLQLKLLLLFIGFLCLNEVRGKQTIQLTQKMYDDLMTKEYIDYIKGMNEKTKDPKIYEELNKFEKYEDRLKVAKEKYPAVYILMKEFFDTVKEHKAKLNDENSREFYRNYMHTVIAYLDPFETELKDSFVKFMKIVIPNWKNLSNFKSAKADFAKEFPNIAKTLDDKNIQAMVDGDKSITIETPSSKKVEEEAPKKKGFWKKFKGIFDG